MKLKQTLLAILFAVGFGVVLGAPSASAATSCAGVATSIVKCTETGSVVCKIAERDQKNGSIIYQKDSNDKFIIDPQTGGRIPATRDESPNPDGKCSDGSAPLGIDNNGVWGILKLAINIMTAGVGILAVAGIVYGSVLYASAGGSAEQTKKAMGIITNVVIGILAYGLMFAILNFIIPGGLFG